MNGKYKTADTLSVWLVVSFGPGLPFSGQKPGAQTVSYSEAKEPCLERRDGVTEKARRGEARRREEQKGA